MCFLVVDVCLVFRLLGSVVMNVCFGLRCCGMALHCLRFIDVVVCCSWVGRIGTGCGVIQQADRYPARHGVLRLRPWADLFIGLFVLLVHSVLCNRFGLFVGIVNRLLGLWFGC